MEFPYTPVIGLARTVFFLQGLRFTILGEENVPAVGGAVMAINHTLSLIHISEPTRPY